MSSGGLSGLVAQYGDHQDDSEEEDETVHQQYGEYILHFSIILYPKIYSANSVKEHVW